MYRLFVLCLIPLFFITTNEAEAKTMHPSKTLKITDLNYAEAGNRKATPVVLIHAFPLNKAMWDDQVEALKSTARVITFDIRGLGKSKLHGPYTLEFVVDDLIALLDYLKIEKAVVCGLSMGGFVALRALERNPERFMGLVLANTKSGSDSDTSKLGRYKALKTIQDQGLSVFYDGFIKSAIAPNILTEMPLVFARTKGIAQVNTTAGVAAAVLALTSRTDTTEGLSKIQVPTLIIQGELDTVIPMEAAQALNEKIKGSKFVVIPKVGHLSNLENPESFNTHLLEFLASF